MVTSMPRKDGDSDCDGADNDENGDRDGDDDVYNKDHVDDDDDDDNNETMVMKVEWEVWDGGGG